jgi:prepilin-type N-terminal cleavage/methylation domain-containing protein
MMQTILRSDEQRSQREAFSLVEMMIVIAIIAIMASLAFVVLGKSGEAAREASTTTIIRILATALREREEAFNDLTASTVYQDPDTPTRQKNGLFRSKVAEFSVWYAAGTGTTISPDLAEIYVRKTMFKSLFPQRRRDLYGYDGVPQEINGFPDDSPLLTRMYSGGARIADSWLGRGLVTPTNTPIPLNAANEYLSTNTRDNAATESSELLYLTLSEGDVYGLPPTELDGIDKNMIGDTDGDGNLEFLDGWGRPLQFYNWPTRLLKDDGAVYWGNLEIPANSGTFYPTASLLIAALPPPGPAVPSSSPRRPEPGTLDKHPLYRDPDDITRSMLRWNLYGTPPTISAVSSLAAPNFTITRVTPSGSTSTTAQGFRPTWYHDANTPSRPMIVSAGPDDELGLYLPTEPGENRLARVIFTQEACESLGDNITNLQRGPK